MQHREQTEPTRLQRIRYAVQSTGLRRALTDLARVALATDPGRDRSFDRRYGTNTAGSVETAELGVDDTEAGALAIRYLPSPDYVTRWMLRNVSLNHRETTFVDLGCGKGRVVVVASEWPFLRVVGVDLSSRLASVAARNAEVIRARFPARTPIEIQVGDAAAFDFPATPLLVHLYHPFETAITARVLDSLRARHEGGAHRIVVAYLLYTGAIDEVLATFRPHRWLPLVRREGSLLGEHDWLIFDSGAGFN